MKINKLFLAALASLSFFACNNSEDTPLPGNEVKSLAVHMSLGTAKTKATAPTEIFTAETQNVNSVLINLTDNNGTVIVSRSVTRDETVDSDWDKLVTPSKGLKFVNISQSVSKVYVYGNPGTAVSDNVITTSLAEQQGSEVLYYGVDEDLTPVVPEPIDPDPTTGQTYTANVTIVPIVARLQITNIRIEDSGSFDVTRIVSGQERTATVEWDAFTANLKGIYMNNFYNNYNNPGTLTNLMKNSTFDQHIVNGQWLFDTPGTNATSYASYSNYQGGNYVNLPMQLNNQAYAFNFFPGTEVPFLHFDLSDISVTNLTSTDPAVFNPSLAQGERFANIVKYYKNTNEEMTASDFVPGTLYNMEVVLIPMLDNDLSNVQYNVMVHVTIAPWVEQTIIPGFDLQP